MKHLEHFGKIVHTLIYCNNSSLLSIIEGLQNQSGLTKDKRQLKEISARKIITVSYLGTILTMKC